VPVEGVGRLTHLMARGLFECGHTVHVITFSDEPRLSFYDGAYVHHITCPLERYSRYLNFPNLHHALNRSHAIHQHVKKLALNDGIQIVDSPLWQFEGLVTATSGDLPVAVRLVTAHRQIAELQNERGEEVLLTGNMEQTLIERATHILPNTQATFRTAQKIYSFQPIDDRYTIVPYGIVPVPDEQVAPFDLERDTGALTVLFVGRLEQRKGIRDLFEAMPLVLEQVPNTRFIIAGGDNSKNDGFQERTGMDYPAYFESHYRDILPRVQFKGSVSEQVLQKLYRSCDLFVAPSLFESFGLIYLEAMNFAKPVIGCRSGGVPEVIDHGVTGLLVEPGAPAALAEALVSLLRSPVKLREMGLAGRQQILERFNYIQMAHSFAQAYRLAIQSFSAGSFSSPDLF
jgi:glycogen(starch) synthase